MGTRSRGLIWIMGVFYILAGINHMIRPDFYMAIMPPWLPWHYPLVILSGVAEIICGVLFLIRRTRKLGAILIILLLIAVFPANIQMAVNYINNSNPYLFFALMRLPLQLVLIAWAASYIKRPE